MAPQRAAPGPANPQFFPSASADFLHKPAGETLIPWAVDCLDSEVLTMTPVAFSLTQGVLLYEEKFENDKS